MNPSPSSPRSCFQWHFFERYWSARNWECNEMPRVLNIGCSNDPMKFGDLALHVDLDDWSKYFKWFRQANADNLPFPDESFDLVILGDILEHVLDPWKCISEAIRVLAPGGALVLTIFMEWRLPGPGQWIKESAEEANRENHALGFDSVEAYQQKHFPNRVAVSNDEIPHLNHINQFTDDDIMGFIHRASGLGMSVSYAGKVLEQTYKGVPWFNWLISLQPSGGVV